jgi:hypothetical protein
MRRCAHTGCALGPAEFTRVLEARTQRCLTPGQRGRRRKMPAQEVHPGFTLNPWSRTLKDGLEKEEIRRLSRISIVASGIAGPMCFGRGLSSTASIYNGVYCKGAGCAANLENVNWYLNAQGGDTANVTCH